MSTEEFKDGAEHLSRKVENKARELGGAAQEQFGRYADSPEDRAQGAARKYSAQACDAMCDATQAVTQKVRDNPIGGLLTAGAVGILSLIHI